MKYIPVTCGKCCWLSLKTWSKSGELYFYTTFQRNFTWIGGRGHGTRQADSGIVPQRNRYGWQSSHVMFYANTKFTNWRGRGNIKYRFIYVYTLSSYGSHDSDEGGTERHVICLPYHQDCLGKRTVASKLPRTIFRTFRCSCTPHHTAKAIEKKILFQKNSQVSH